MLSVLVIHQKKQCGIGNIIFRLITELKIGVCLLWTVIMLLSTSLQADENTLFDQLDQLETLLQVPHQKTRASMIDAAQVWRRQKDKERWDVQPMQLSPKVKKEAMDLLTSMGLVNALKPDKQHYDYILWLGATIPRMRSRLNQIINLWNQGIRAKHIVSLTGQRPLTAKIDKPKLLLQEANLSTKNSLVYPSNETEAAKMIWLLKDLPTTMQTLGCQFISSERRWQSTYWQRPNTRDTLKKWLATKPTPGSVLVISDQPNALYQKVVTETELPDTFTVSVSAEAISSKNDISLYLDALALWLHNMPREKTMSKSLQPVSAPVGH
ncbi:MAG: hypothetical protein PUP46_07245 [Endozoicomonas sp. (ex Botrylloides leachii)]|nr:hypothetical protein [Endozoicomonas sp. (ex Botrylloides leachii)]